MQSWKTRLIEEKIDLDAKLERLKAYLESNPSIDPIDIDLLKQQYAAQKSYSDILSQRIARFTP